LISHRLGSITVRLSKKINFLFKFKRYHRRGERREKKMVGKKSQLKFISYFWRLAKKEEEEEEEWLLSKKDDDVLYSTSYYHNI
jgi:hypothetical protein